MKHPVKLLPLVTALALAAGQVQALGLGALEVKSQLSQPLVAEIPLIGVGPGELDALSVRLAPPEAFERVGLPRPSGVTANLQFSVGRNARGEPVVRVTTSGRVDDPFVSFLLEADWGRGSVVREFTALIDPPHIAAARVTPIASATVAATPVRAPEPMAPPTAPTAPVAAPLPEPAPVAAAPLPAPPPPAPVAPPPRPAAEAPRPAPPPVAASSPRAGDGQRVVQEGETLWRIANETRQGVSPAQMMLAIQRANPEAFIGNNINQMRRGAVLRIPTADEAQSLSREAAEAQVREQMAAWRGGAVPVPAPVPADRPALASAPSPTPVPAPARPAAATGGPRLEIAPPTGGGQAGAQSGAVSGGSGSELRAELQQVREDLNAREAEIRELRSRLAEQEALANDQQRLLSLKDSQLSAMEEALRRQREGGGEAVDGAVDVPAAEDAPVAELAGADTAPPAEAPATPVAQPEPPPAAPAPAPVAEAPWFQQPLVLGLGGLVLVGGLVGLLLRRRQPKGAGPSKAAMPATAAASSASRSRLSEDADFLSKLGPASTAAEPSAPDADQPGGEPRIEAAPEAPTIAPAVPTTTADEGGVVVPPPARDPVIAELSRRVQATPGDLETHVALLRQFYNAGDTEGFLAAAEAMRGQVAEPGDPRWREVVVMGMGLVPGHGLFRELQWNPISAADVRTRNDADLAPRPAPAPEPDFDAGITAKRPAVQVPEPDSVPSGLDDTRLELAKAYIEIGDTDGARGMLEEVLAEGDAAARAEAERLLKQLG